MKYKSRAISLTYIKQGNSSIVSKIFTEEKGLQTFIIKGVRSKKSKKKLSYFEPLKLLNIDATFNSKKSLQYLAEVSIGANFNSIQNKMYKSFIGFFIAEVNSKVLQENEQNMVLFNFIWNTSIKLYLSENMDPNFTLKYLLSLSKLLGFYPSSSTINRSFFELESGGFYDKRNPLKTYLNRQMSACLKSLLKNQEVIIPKTIKSQFLKELLRYYKFHHYNLDGVSSHLIVEKLRQ